MRQRRQPGCRHCFQVRPLFGPLVTQQNDCRRKYARLRSILRGAHEAETYLRPSTYVASISAPVWHVPWPRNVQIHRTQLKIYYLSLTPSTSKYIFKGISWNAKSPMPLQYTISRTLDKRLQVEMRRLGEDTSQCL